MYEEGSEESTFCLIVPFRCTVWFEFGMVKLIWQKLVGSSKIGSAAEVKKNQRPRLEPKKKFRMSEKTKTSKRSPTRSPKTQQHRRPPPPLTPIGKESTSESKKRRSEKTPDSTIAQLTAQLEALKRKNRKRIPWIPRVWMRPELNSKKLLLSSKGGVFIRRYGIKIPKSRQIFTLKIFLNQTKFYVRKCFLPHNYAGKLD